MRVRISSLVPIWKLGRVWIIAPVLKTDARKGQGFESSSFRHLKEEMTYKNSDKQREYQRLWIAKRRAEFFAGKRCSIWWCGSTTNLELDHIDPKSKIHHAIWSWAKERREAEISKCQILCEPCHMDKTISQMSRTYEHGTGSMYQRGCKCASCKVWKSLENKRNRK